MQNKLIFVSTLVSCLLITGCAHNSPAAIDTVIQLVEVPISVPCKAEVPPVPEFNFDKLLEELDIFDKTKSLLADRKLHLAYEAELLAALTSCF